MPKTDGHITKQKILTIAEKLFSEKGYDGTSVDEIARLSKVNKATVYYHFKNKREVLDVLTRSILVEAKKMINQSIHDSHNNSNRGLFRKHLEDLIRFMTGKSRLIKILVMESLKTGNGYDSLYRCADMIMDNEKDGVYQILDSNDHLPFNSKTEYLVYEFFTGFIPIIMFVALEDSWAEYYKCEKNKMVELFIDSFERSHMSVHQDI